MDLPHWERGVVKDRTPKKQDTPGRKRAGFAAGARTKAGLFFGQKKNFFVARTKQREKIWQQLWPQREGRADANLRQFRAEGGNNEDIFR